MQESQQIPTYRRKKKEIFSSSNLSFTLLICLILYQWTWFFHQNQQCELLPEYHKEETVSFKPLWAQLRASQSLHRPDPHQWWKLHQSTWAITPNMTAEVMLRTKHMTFMSDDWNRTNFWLLNAGLNELIVTLFPLLWQVSVNKC